MPTAVTPKLDAPSPFSDEDKMMHTAKYAERTFGAPIEEIGTLEVEGSKAALLVTVDGTVHRLHWQRQPNGEIFWFANGEEEPFRAGPSDRALARLRSVLARG